MAEQKEIIEKWREEFINLSKLGSLASIYEKDRFLNHEVNIRWRGFLMAKQSQPVIDVSLGQVIEINDFDRGYNQAVKDMIVRIESSGYTVKELS